jgi:hypothetical protein
VEWIKYGTKSMVSTMRRAGNEGGIVQNVSGDGLRCLDPAPSYSTYSGRIPVSLR